jgi:hypothetical protein
MQALERVIVARREVELPKDVFQVNSETDLAFLH